MHTIEGRLTIQILNVHLNVTEDTRKWAVKEVVQVRYRIVR